MSLRIERNFVIITHDCLRTEPGVRNPPWKLKDCDAHRIEDLINRKGISVQAFALEGRIEINDGTVIPITLKAVERHPGMYQFFAYPTDEDVWVVAEEDPSAFTD
ncbi:MAG TPA: hypothetical protein VN397_01175 [Candidatus Methylomirabilis sp.]|nr:hypothetical protein [Candidatus Methylomirabilis sp.]